MENEPSESGPNIDPRAKLEDQIQQLADKCHLYCELALGIKQFIDKHRPGGLERLEYDNRDDILFLVTVHNLCIYECVSVLKSLLFPTGREASFDRWLELLPKDTEGSPLLSINHSRMLSQIKENYEKFRPLRNKVVDHKDDRSIGDPEMITLIKIDYEHVLALSAISRQILDLIYQDGFFQDPYSGGNSSNIVHGMRSIFELIDLKFRLERK